MDMGVILGQMLVLLLMMLVGYFAHKKGWLNDVFDMQLSRLVVNVFNPILVINGVLGQNIQTGGSKIILNLIFVLLYFALSVIAGILMPVILHVKRQQKSIYQLMCVFGNIGFMGIPVVKSVYGSEAGIYVAFYILLYNLMLYTYGMYLARCAAEEEGVLRTNMSKNALLKKMVNPGMIAAFFAVVLFVTGVKIPGPVSTFCDYMGNATIPLSMLLIGAAAAQTDLKAVFGEWRIYLFILLRMLLLPVGMIWLIRSIAIPKAAVDEIVFGVFIIELAMPVGNCAVLVVKEQGADMDDCMKGVVLSTLASVMTIPILGLFL